MHFFERSKVSVFKCSESQERSWYEIEMFKSEMYSLCILTRDNILMFCSAAPTTLDDARPESTRKGGTRNTRQIQSQEYFGKNDGQFFLNDSQGKEQTHENSERSSDRLAA